MKLQDVALIAGAAAVGWYLAPKEVKDELSSLTGSGGVSLGGLLSGFQFPEAGTNIIERVTETITEKIVQVAVPDSVENAAGNIEDWWNMFIPNGGDGAQDDSSDAGDNNTDWWNMFIPQGGKPASEQSAIPAVATPLNSLRTGVIRAAGVETRGLGGAFLTGWNILKPLPWASKAKAAGTAIRDVAAAGRAGNVAKDVLPKVGDNILEFAAKKGINVITHGGDNLLWDAALRAAGKGSTSVAVRLGAKAGLGTAGKVAAHAVPIIGWGLTLADIGADVARLFGADVTEWLGVSGVIEPFLGYNPLEKWVAEQDAAEKEYYQQTGGFGNTGKATAGIALSPLDPAILLGMRDAAVGQPERPTMGEDWYPFVSELPAPIWEAGNNQFTASGAQLDTMQKGSDNYNIAKDYAFDMASKAASETGGQVAWSSEKGYHVIEY